MLTEQLAVLHFRHRRRMWRPWTPDDIQVTVDLADFGSAVGTYTVPAEVTVSGHDVGVSGDLPGAGHHLRDADRGGAG